MKFNLRLWTLSLFFSLSFLYFFYSPPIVLGTDEFETTHSLRYEVKTDGRVTVSQDIFLTNKLSNVYATQYSLSLQTERIENIKANDGEGPLKIQTAKTDELFTINLTFNQQVVGKGKTLSFYLTYDVWDLALKNGEIWEIFIPKLSSQTHIDNCTLTLIVPLNFGNPAFITPQPSEQKQEGNFTSFYFTKEQILNSGISAAFGKFQIFDFVLDYHLENSGLTLGETEIALPPDTAFQQVFYHQITPIPLNVTVDPDENWLAKYRLKPQEKLNITAKGKVKIFAQPQEKFLIPTQETLEKNLLPQKYWEVNSPLIQAEAKQLKTPKSIYQYVVKTLNYDISRVKESTSRLGAAQALKNPSQAICTEFTDLFIALVRAAGIPAREVNGYAYTTNIKIKPLSLVADILHSWPEYWDEKRQVFVPVDPTWEKTTGGIDFFNKTDLNHFVFVIHGQDSQTPYPAGSYKTEGSFGKDVQIAFGKYEAEEKPKFEIEVDLQKKIFSKVGGKGKVIIKNIGSVAIYDLSLEFALQNLVLVSPESLKKTIKIMPPYAKIEIPIQIKTTSWLSWGKGTLRVLVDSQEKFFEIKIVSLIWQLALPLVLLISLAIGVLFMLKIKPKNVD